MYIHKVFDKSVNTSGMFIDFFKACDLVDRTCFTKKRESNLFFRTIQKSQNKSQFKQPWTYTG